jgi:hypothetical protein
VNVLGEFTVVAWIEPQVNIAEAKTPSPDELALEFGEMTANKASSRRGAIAELAKRHGMAPNDVYAAIEAARKSG